VSWLRTQTLQTGTIIHKTSWFKQGLIGLVMLQAVTWACKDTPVNAAEQQKWLHAALQVKQSQYSECAARHGHQQYIGCKEAVAGVALPAPHLVSKALSHLGTSALTLLTMSI
jgi:hypothetical protein